MHLHINIKRNQQILTIYKKWQYLSTVYQIKRSPEIRDSLFIYGVLTFYLVLLAKKGLGNLNAFVGIGSIGIGTNLSGKCGIERSTANHYLESIP